MTELGKSETLRYSRHLVMPEIGIEGQRRLKAGRVLCVGAGGLGSPTALYLAAAGVGQLGLVEFDTLDLSNLQRQILYRNEDVGRAKLDVAVEQLSRLNPEIEVRPHPLRLDAGNILEVIRDYDVIVDGSDNFATRYLVNDACVHTGKPNVHASVLRFEGQLSVFDATRGPCLRCLFPEPPPPDRVPSCSEGGVLGAVPGVLGSLQALEAIKLIVGSGEPLIGRLLLFEGLGGSFRELRIERDPDCPCCGRSTGAGDYEVFAATWAAGNGAEAADEVERIAPEQLEQQLSGAASMQLLDVRQPEEYAIAHIPGSRLLPLGELELRLEELDRDAEYVVICHRGGRSERACRQLRAAGFRRLLLLEGGVDAWAAVIDTDLPRY